MMPLSVIVIPKPPVEWRLGIGDFAKDCLTYSIHCFTVRGTLRTEVDLARVRLRLSSCDHAPGSLGEGIRPFRN
jgi:hypothetical protein